MRASKRGRGYDALVGAFAPVSRIHVPMTRLSPSPLTPSQRTAMTARVVVTAGILFAVEAAWRGSVARTMMAFAMLALGAGLLFFAKRAD